MDKFGRRWSKGHGSSKQKEIFAISGKTIPDKDQPRKRPSAPQLVVDRSALTVDGRHKKCFFEVPPKPSVPAKLKSNLVKRCTCTGKKVKKFIYGKLPILSWIVGYDIKNWLAADIISGCTVAIVHIPQGMGYALLANIPAICGIYMGFFQSLVYAFLGTSRHNSMGTFAVIVLMTGKIVEEIAPRDHSGGNTTAALVGDIMENGTEFMALNGTKPGAYTQIEVATTTCLMVGIFHMIFGIFHLGGLAVFLSDMLVSGFTTGAAVHVLASQLKDLMGISFKSMNGPLKIIYIFWEAIKVILTVNVVTLLITTCSIVVLVTNNEILKPIVAKFSIVPIPIELLVVVAGTAASYLLNLSEEYKVTIVGNVPTGFPPPAMPPLELWQRVTVDSFVIAIVSYAITFSLAKMFAIKRDYQVDSTQEFYASGIANIATCFFSCGPTCTALARTLIQDGVGGKTQMASFVVCFILALVLLFIGPVFETLPKCVLASIIVVALKGMFMQFFDMIAMWKVSKVEAMMWIITFLAVVVIDIDFGLVIGIIFALLVLLVRNQNPTTFKLGRVPNTDIYLEMKAYPQAKEVPGMRLYKIVGPMHFACCENLKSLVIKGTGLDPKVLKKLNKKKTEDQTLKEKNIMDEIEKGSYIIHPQENEIRVLILDLSGVSYIDTSGGKFLEQLRKEYERGHVCLCITGMPEHVYAILSKGGYLKGFPPKHLFHSTHDAVVILTSAIDRKNGSNLYRSSTNL